jgi:4a-hydroxytetrahydrobiopterin dehydratase
MPYADPLSAEEAAAALASLPEWSREGETIQRTVTLASFRDAIALVNAVADAAEDADHHPRIEVDWKRVTFVLTTHAAKALTRRDVQLAARIDGLAGQFAPIESAGR